MELTEDDFQSSYKVHNDFPDSDKYFEKFIATIDLETNTNTQIVFVQDNTELESTVNFSQYIFEDKKLLTIIGEIHGHQFGCNGASISIEEYVGNVVTTNESSKVLLEYNKNDDPSSTSSTVIHNVYNTLREINKTNYIIPFDERNFFLTPRYHYALYSNDIFSFSQREIFDRYVTPFYVNNNAFNIDPSDYSPRSYMFLTGSTNSYLQDIDDDLKHILANNLPNWNTDKNIVVTRLRDVWKKVTDFYILRKLFKNDGTTEIIIILGDAHRVNIQTILRSSSFTQLINLSGSKNHCVPLFQTYKFN